MENEKEKKKNKKGGGRAAALVRALQTLGTSAVVLARKAANPAVCSNQKHSHI